MLLPLNEATAVERFGAKSAVLARALRAGLSTPEGVALSWDSPPYRQEPGWAADVLASLGGLVAVRSSAVDEDGERQSFAGQHRSILGVRSPQGLLDAIEDVRRSGRSLAATRYREQLGLGQEVRMAVLIQRQLSPRCAGVLFSRDPVTGEDARLVEACAGLGEDVVSGEADPERVRFGPGMHLVEHVASEDAEGGQRLLDTADLRALDDLATRCDALFGGPSDLEWALDEERLWLLQRRPVTT